jgi:hypothetical protein
MKSVRYLAVAVVLSAVALVLPSAASAKAMVLSPVSFQSNGDLISGWNWLRAPGHTATWKFDATALQSARYGSVYLNFAPLVTNGVNGGSGYRTSVRLTVTGVSVKPRTTSISLYNPFRPIDPSDSSGLGYQTYGYQYLSSSIWKGATTITVQVTYPFNRYHLAVKSSALFIGYSVAG